MVKAVVECDIRKSNPLSSIKTTLYNLHTIKILRKLKHKITSVAAVETSEVEVEKTLKVDGKLTEWHTNDQKKNEINYKDGKKDGNQNEYYDNGQLKWERNYNEDGKQDGKWTEWHTNGQKKNEINYKDGKKDGKWTEWYENGRIWTEAHYKDGKSDGKWTEWHKNDQKKTEENYKDGELDNETKYEYYDNGQLKWERNYNKDGNQDGKWTEWYENGQKKKEGNYKDSQHQILEMESNRTWDHYERRMKMIDSLSKTFNFKSIHFLQPQYQSASSQRIYSDRSNKLLEIIYKEGKSRASSHENFYDISNCMDEYRRYFLDDHHTGRVGNEIISKCIYNDLEKYLN